MAEVSYVIAAHFRSNSIEALIFGKAASVRGFLMPLYQSYAAEARDRRSDLFSASKIQVAIDPDRVCEID